MVLFTYEKKGAAVYLPHLDLLRAAVRTIRRAGLDVKYSEGFSPHMLLYFGPPLPVGTASECEQCVAVTGEGPETFMERYNAVCPAGIRITAAEYTAANTNPAGSARAAEYEITFPGAGALPIEEIMAQKVLNVTFKGKDGEKTKDVRGGVYFIERAAKEDTIRCVLAAGNDNLRADRFAWAAAAYAGTDLEGKDIAITRKKIYTEIPKAIRF